MSYLEKKTVFSGCLWDSMAFSASLAMNRTRKTRLDGTFLALVSSKTKLEEAKSA